MSQIQDEPAPRAGGFARLVGGALLAAAVVYQGWNARIGMGRDDTNHLETPLLLIVERGVREGPGVLYGPFTEANPLVLIHAPLYYRLSGLAAGLLTRLGADPVLAAMAGGRGVAALGMLGTLAATWWLARADGAARRAGLWAALLVAAAPVFGSFPVTVRPDTLALAFQTAGVALALGWLHSSRRPVGPLLAAYAAFGLALGTKQSYVVTPALTSAFLLAEAVRGRARLVPIVAAHALGAALTAGYYGLEQWLTGGEMARSAFVVAGQLRRFSYAGWGQLAAVAFEVVKESAGLIALAAAVVVAAPRRAAGSSLDGRLWAYLLAESALAAWLCVGSTGSWVNYAMPPLVFAAALIARALDRAISARPPLWRLAPILAAAVLELAVDVRYVAISARGRAAEAARLRELFADPVVARHPPEARYFVARPQNNRLYGRIALAHDDWLYTAFEQASAVAPRSEWLQAAVARGPVRLVIVAREAHRDPRRIEGTYTLLPALGYRQVGRHDLYDVWERP